MFREWKCMFCVSFTVLNKIQYLILLCGLVFRVPGNRSRRSGFDSQSYQIFWEVVGLERGPLSLVSKIEELLGRNSSGSDLENREYSRRDPSHWPHDTLYRQKLALTSPTSGVSLSVMVHSRIEATEFVFFFLLKASNSQMLAIIM
jgi:hypothetical protein